MFGKVRLLQRKKSKKKQDSFWLGDKGLTLDISLFPHIETRTLAFWCTRGETATIYYLERPLEQLEASQGGERGGREGGREGGRNEVSQTWQQEEEEEGDEEEEEATAAMCEMMKKRRRNKERGIFLLLLRWPYLLRILRR